MDAHTVPAARAHYRAKALASHFCRAYSAAEDETKKNLPLFAAATKSLDFVAQKLQMRQRLLVTTKRKRKKHILRVS
jgi:hypothetical protein